MKKRFIKLFYQRDLYENMIYFENILIEHDLPIDKSVKIQVKLIMQ